MNHASEILDRKTDVLAFLKTRFPLYDKSNIFFRDIQYGIQVFLGRKGIKAGYPESEKIAREFASLMEREGVFVAIDRQSWALHYPEFRTPPSKPAPAAPAPRSVAPRTVAPVAPVAHSVAPHSVAPHSVAPPKPASEQESE
jgi:hypothetical protein